MTGRLRPGVLFDVDGTLVDTNYLHALAWSRAFRDTGEWAPMNAIHRLVGMGSDQLVPRLLGHDSPDAVAARPQRYRELAADIRPFPGAAELLRQVHNCGLAVVLATSAPHDDLQMLRKALDADDALDGQTTADDVGESKPAPEVFLTAMARCGIDARRSASRLLQRRRAGTHRDRRRGGTRRPDQSDALARPGPGHPGPSGRLRSAGQ